MSKKCLMSFGAFAVNTLITFATVQLMSLVRVSEWLGVSIGISVFVVLLVLYCCFNKKSKAVYYAAIISNAIADGLAASSIFTHIGVFPDILESLAVFAVMTALFALYCLLTNIKVFQTYSFIFMLLYILILIGTAIALLCVFDLRPVYILASLQLIIFIAFFITLGLSARDSNRHFKHVAGASFAALAVVILVALLVLSDGDFDVSGAGGDGSGGILGPKNKRNPYIFGE